MGSVSTTSEPVLAGSRGFSQEEVRQFEEHGFVIVRGLGSDEFCTRMTQVTREHLDREISPVEFEAEVNYPGAPATLDSPGGRTIRRLKQTHSRDIVFTEWIRSPELLTRLSQLLGPDVVMPLAHHNCVMTKQPQHSSETGWHQDIRYWSFQRPELVSVWLALGSEYPKNGGLWVVPGSHRMAFDRTQFDDAMFFKQDEPRNQPILDTAVPVELNRGDVLFFHCRTLHAASRNENAETKYSVVFTFRSADNPPLPGSRSARSGELLLPRTE
ncbi:phytanoyl-CoA dioxygenase family protein [bacterium]|nr:phytanoyl-CoA dioxygenase family protein [bacterium]